jgi:hypothetical protein
MRLRFNLHRFGLGLGRREGLGLGEDRRWFWLRLRQRLGLGLGLGLREGLRFGLGLRERLRFGLGLGLREGLGGRLLFGRRDERLRFGLGLPERLRCRLQEWWRRVHRGDVEPARRLAIVLGLRLHIRRRLDRLAGLGLGKPVRNGGLSRRGWRPCIGRRWTPRVGIRRPGLDVRGLVLRRDTIPARVGRSYGRLGRGRGRFRGRRLERWRLVDREGRVLLGELVWRRLDARSGGRGLLVP